MAEAVTFELYEIGRGYPALMVASVTGPLKAARREIDRYALVYGMDGPVEVRVAVNAP